MKTIAAYADGTALGGQLCMAGGAWLQFALAGGDDYELLFTAAPSRRAAVLAAGQRSATPVTRIGQIEAEPGLRVRDLDGQWLAPDRFAGFDHFA